MSVISSVERTSSGKRVVTSVLREEPTRLGHFGHRGADGSRRIGECRTTLLNDSTRRPERASEWPSIPRPCRYPRRGRPTTRIRRRMRAVRRQPNGIPQHGGPNICLARANRDCSIRSRLSPSPMSVEAIGGSRDMYQPPAASAIRPSQSDAGDVRWRKANLHSARKVGTPAD
jgi:hypothetical protein